MILEGKVFKFGDNINTDWIISGRYKFSITDMKKLAQYLFEDIRPNFYQEIIPNKSIIMAGENFGMGSSREQAPWVIKEAGIVCVVAKSFARIFYRNSFNIGLPLIEADTSCFQEGNQAIIHLDKGEIKKADNQHTVKFIPWNNFQKELIQSEGIINYLKKHKDFKIK
ncbi:MAG: 3-isopropylmalate dehydratase [Candidatus Omnitrophota bacterium]|nr:MAG: 3-isopropylmalate dehydratase [Candidatus Omnitrophota bacterium]